MKKVFNIAILVIQCIICFCQSNNGNYFDNFTDNEIQKIGLNHLAINDSILIRIWQSDYQVLELRRTKFNEVNGRLINYVTKIDKQEKANKVVKEIIELMPNIVNNLMDDLFLLGIQSIKDSGEIEDYPNGFDGKTTSIEVQTHYKHRITSYWEIENDNYLNSDNEDIKQIRSILNRVNNEVSWWPLFKRFRDNLKPGKYKYGGFIMIVKNKDE